MNLKSELTDLFYMNLSSLHGWLLFDPLPVFNVLSGLRLNYKNVFLCDIMQEA